LDWWEKSERRKKSRESLGIPATFSFLLLGHFWGLNFIHIFFTQRSWNANRYSANMVTINTTRIWITRDFTVEI